MNEVALRHAIGAALNRHNAEQVSDTPDFILAEFLVACLGALDSAILARSTWYGRVDSPGSSVTGWREQPYLSRLAAGLAQVNYRCPPDTIVVDHALAVIGELIEERDDALDQVHHVREAFDSATKQIAEMHAAAVGDVRCPVRGVVEDVEDLRLRALQLERENARLQNQLTRWRGAVIPEPEQHGYTRHGHPCCNKVRLDQGVGLSIARCGGPGICTRCVTDASKVHSTRLPPTGNGSGSPESPSA